ncbi:sugar transferase [Clostridia bacterium]|nr:sugar transferase [Clostridia bacterium]
MKNYFASKTYGILQGILSMIIIYYSYHLALSLFNYRHGHVYLFSDIAVLMPFLLLGMMVLFDVFGLHEAGSMDGIQVFLSLLLSGMIGNAGLVVIAVGFNVFVLPAKLFIYAYIIQLVLLFPLLLVRDHMYTKRVPALRILVIGAKGELEAIKRQLESKSYDRCHVVARVESVSQITDDVLLQTDALYMASICADKERQRLVAFALMNDLPVLYEPDILQIGYRNAKVVRFDDTLLFRMDNRSMSLEERFFKRTMDLVVAFLMLVVFSPLMLLAAIAIKVEDRGPAMFRQKRVKKEEKEYELYKFRTMFVNAEKMSGPVLATSDDPRITKVGSFLRTTRIDELPQLINVLRGEMSLVGPRPERPFFVDQYKETIPNYCDRFRVKPGITGLAQVDGKYSTDVKDKLKFDLLYILNYSMLLDIRILLQTVRTVLQPGSAEGIKKRYDGPSPKRRSQND